MADAPVYKAHVTIYDSAKKAGRVELRVDATDGKAYIAAADTAARAATKVGLLLASVVALIQNAGGIVYEWGLDATFLQTTFAYPLPADQIWRSNKLKVDYSTTNNGLPASGSFTIPARDPAEYTLESNGINVIIAGTPTTEIEDLITQIEDTLISSYGTAVPAVNEITVNDE
jgi:hypothetical protein